jgi:predicted RNA-binding Zn-ribbon protein involved in translation (DUF1610 family)
MKCPSCGSTDAAVKTSSDVETTYECACGEIYTVDADRR